MANFFKVVGSFFKKNPEAAGMLVSVALQTLSPGAKAALRKNIQDALKALRENRIQDVRDTLEGLDAILQ